MAATVLYCISFASSEASKPHSCCGNRKSPGTILLGLAWIPHLFHICFSSIHCGRRKGMALISWTWDISPPLEAGTGSTPLKLGVELRLGVEGRQFSPKNALTKRKKKKKRCIEGKKIHLSTTVNCNCSLLFPQHSYPTSEYNSISVNERGKWRLSHSREHCCLWVRNVA